MRAPGRGMLRSAFRTEVDFQQVLYRLALRAQSLFTSAACLGRDQVVLPGGDSAADLASATLLKLLDALETSVTWSPTKGAPTTAGVLAYLREVLRRDFLDFVRSKRATTSVYPDDERADGQDLWDSQSINGSPATGTPRMNISRESGWSG
jgi:DNA-directed RNA polymerase specialized sigma24 family protein